MSNSLCIIPARGGSKRIKKKNIKDFLGSPIISYSILKAFKSNLFSEIMVSTDDKEIADISRKYGASVPFMRSKKNSDDYATTSDVLDEVIKFYHNNNRRFDYVCIIYPTAPLIKINDLIKGKQALLEFDSSLPVTKFHYPVQRSFKLKNEKIEYNWPEFQNSRSQDLDDLFHDAGQWYWIKTSSYNGSIIQKKSKGIILNNLDVQDIDSLDDWKLAELKYKNLLSR